ncbi:hypothetical protein [Sphingomicrobium aestuariivivum]|uniref:hypothetical protein n=1 Tax=Sphingomicrobium aestuariivivum TaxID=1582356 RepID=UPI001FD69D97|nr:hypothetical protein [Sphingomicrobium aestuariivivum]MCJ8190040.1 hypothetical protein [Sphingomicrobium aestuariivivum]
MRLSPLLIALGLTASTLSVPGMAQRAGDDDISSRSVALVAQGDAALAEGDLVAADNAFEAALVADPRNRAAYVAMAKVSIRQNLYGQAIRLTRKALTIEPTDRAALAVQGEAYAALGAKAKAEANLARLERICASACAEQDVIEAAIARGPVMAANDNKAEAQN